MKWQLLISGIMESEKHGAWSVLPDYISSVKKIPEDTCFRGSHWLITTLTKAPTLGPPDAKSRLIRKDHDAGKDGRQEEKGTTEYEMVG